MNGRGLSSAVLTALQTAAVAPIPSVRQITAATATVGVRDNARTALRTSAGNDIGTSKGWGYPSDGCRRPMVASTLTGVSQGLTGPRTALPARPKANVPRLSEAEPGSVEMRSV